MVTKLEKRKRRSRKTRSKIKELEQFRLSVHRSSRHIYAQIIAPEDNRVVASTSTLDPEVRKLLDEKAKGKKDAAKIVGELIAKKAKKAKIEKVAFVAMVPPALSIMCPLPSLFTQRMGRNLKNTFLISFIVYDEK